MGGGRKNGRREWQGERNGKEGRAERRQTSGQERRKEVRCGQDRILRGRESDTAEREMQFVAASVAVESQPRVDR